MSRQTKTPRERAEEALSVAERAVERLHTKWKKATADADRLSHERDQAVARRDYLASNPDLGKQQITATTKHGATTSTPSGDAA